MPIVNNPKTLADTFKPQRDVPRETQTGAASSGFAEQACQIERRASVTAGADMQHLIEYFERFVAARVASATHDLQMIADHQQRLQGEAIVQLTKALDRAEEALRERGVVRGLGDDGPFWIGPVVTEAMVDAALREDAGIPASYNPTVERYKPWARDRMRAILNAALAAR